MKTRKYRSSVKPAHKQSNKYTRRKHGGKVIGSGGYGCVFRPALKCKGVSKRVPKTISKLMLNKHVKRENKEITKYLPILRKIPNYKNYFIIEDANVCYPAPLTKYDLNDFNVKCKTLVKRNINVKNINSKLDKLSILNLQDGGEELGHYIYSGLTINEIKTLNVNMIRLLVYGILPMNKYHVYHADIKESNIVVDMHNKYVRLIDWGLSAYTTGKSIPSIMQNKPFQYNLPFSIVLFNDTFKSSYSTFLNNTRMPLDATLVYEFVKVYIAKWNAKRGKGHLETITSIWRGVTGKQNIIDSIINPYLSSILIEYTTTSGNFDMMEYFKNVFLKQIDLWGFIMCYSSFLETGYTNENIKYLIINYLYRTPAEPINIEDLVNDLQNLF